MEFEDFKGYFNIPNMTMITGAVGGFILGGLVGDWIAGKIGGSGIQKALGMLIGGLGVGAAMYAVGRNLEPGSSFKPLAYGLAIGAAMPGVMATISSLLGSNENTKHVAAMFARGIKTTDDFVIENIE